MTNLRKIIRFTNFDDYMRLSKFCIIAIMLANKIIPTKKIVLLQKFKLKIKKHEKNYYYNNAYFM